MQLFVDTANVDEIREAVSWGVVSGVTTNPSLVAKEKRDFHTILQEITALVPGPVSAEVLSPEADAMVDEARRLSRVAGNVVIKIPMTKDGLKATRMLAAEGIKTNMTLVFSGVQGLLAARAGASFVSPFVGRLDDAGHDGMQVVRDLVAVFERHGIATRVIAASIRHPLHVLAAAMAGAHVATVPFKVLEQMIRHPLTDVGVERFLADWKAAKA